MIAQDGNEARVRELYQQGCAKIRLPRSGGGSTIDAVMINSSGGMTGGDQLNWAFTARKNSSLCVTSQACERLYKSSGGTARADIALTVEAGAKLVWLPQETIVFEQSAFSRQVNVEMAENAELLLVEPVIFGRTAMGEEVSNAAIKDRWRISREGRLIHAEDFRLEGDIQSALAANAIGNGNRAFATIVLIAPRAESLLNEARKIVEQKGGASFWNGKLVTRLLATDGYELRQRLIPLLDLLYHPNKLPKIWTS